MARTRKEHSHRQETSTASKKDAAGVPAEPVVDALGVSTLAVTTDVSSKVESKSDVQRKLSFDSARQYIMYVLTQAQLSVEDLRKRVLENQRVARASERTMVFLDSARVQVEQAVKLVRKTPIADLRSKAVSESLALANMGVHAFNASATQIPTQVAIRISTARAEALRRINDAVIAVNSWRAAAVSYGVQKLSEFDKDHYLSAKACDWANVAVERTKSIDEQFRVSENAKMLLEGAIKMNQKWKVSENALKVAKNAQSMGDTLTGSRVSPVVNYVSELAVSSYNNGVTSLLAAKAAIKEQALQQRKSLEAQKNSSKQAEQNYID